MAATLTNVEYNVLGAGPGGKWIYADVTLDSAYAVGGESVTNTTLGLKIIKAVFVADNEDGFLIDANIAADKTSVTFKVWVFGSASTSAAQPYESKVQDLSAVTFGVLVRGI